MGVYIPNMEKPKFCKCEEYNCFAWDDEKYKCKITEWKKPCPLIEIVRCGECKHWNEGFCNNGRADANLRLDKNCFCDEGERRADEHTDKRD